MKSFDKLQAIIEHFLEIYRAHCGYRVDIYPVSRIILNEESEDDVLVIKRRLPYQISRIKTLNLHYGPCTCRNKKQCKVDIKLSVEVKDNTSWPIVTLEMESGQDINPDFLNYILVWVKCDDDWLPYTLRHYSDVNITSKCNFYRYCKKAGLQIKLDWPCISDK